MAQKAATIFIVDVGSSMSLSCRGLPHMSQFEAVTQYMYDTIANKILSQRKTDQVGVVKVGIEKWEINGGDVNNLGSDINDDDSADETVSYVQTICPIKQLSSDSLRELKAQIKPSMGNDSRSLGAALKLGIKNIYDHCKALKYQKRIVLLTNASGSLSEETVSSIRNDLKFHSIELVVIIAQFTEYEPECVSYNIRQLKGLCNTLKGIYIEAPEVIAALKTPKIKPVKPVRGYMIPLIFGDIDEHPNAFSFSVDTYPCTRSAAVPNATAYASVMTSQSPLENNTKTETNTRYYGSEKTDQFKEANLEQLDYKREYYIKNEDESKQIIAEEERVSAYRYGQELIPLTKLEDARFKYNTYASLQMVGFVPNDSIKHWILMGPCDFVVPTIATRTTKTDSKERNSILMSSISRAMIEINLAMIGRFVKKNGSEPEMVLLVPKVEPDIEGLIMCRVPFDDDVRYFKFPPLTKNIGLISKKPQSDAKYVPDEEMISAMGDFIDTMDLDQSGLASSRESEIPLCDLDSSGANADNNEHDASNKEDNYFRRDLLFNPLLHRINAIIKTCAIKESTDDSVIPEDLPILSEFKNPHKTLVTNSESNLNRLKHLLDIKEVSDDTKRLRGNGSSARDTRGQEGLDVEAILNGIL